MIRPLAAAWLASRAAAGDPAPFPLAVWVQDPANAMAFKAAGVNLYVGLWKGPTEAQLAALKAAGMPVVCEQNAVGLAHREDPIIAGWMHGDEPDNAQSLGEGKGWGPPVPAADIAAGYARIKRADPGRPVLLNLGQGVAWDGWYGRGVRTNHPEDYPAYLAGCDIASFDIYPAVHDHPDCAGKLELVPFGVERLRAWSRPGTRVWCCLEASRIGNARVKPTPAQVRSEAWMAILAGARGLIYFVHQFEPEFVEASLLRDPGLLAGVTALNAEIQSLAPLLDAPAPPAAEAASARADDPAARVLLLDRRHSGARHLLAALPRAAPARVTFTLGGRERRGTAEVLGEGRAIAVAGGAFADDFPPYGVRHYRLTPAP